MASYSVFQPPRGTTPLDRALRTQFVRDGFSWGAFLVAPVWLVYRRMWWVLAIYVLAALAFTLFMEWWAPGDGVAFAASLGVSLVLGFEGHALRRWSLRRKGWREAGAATGAGRDDAERGFFAHMGPGPRAAAP